MWLIGQRCKRSNVFSRLILIGRGLAPKILGNLVSEFPSLFSFHCAFANESAIKKYEVSADDREGPPVPIPNTEVKLTGAEDTWLGDGPGK